MNDRRAKDPPLTTRECATWMNVPFTVVHGAIVDGELEAEGVDVNGRRLLRIHHDAFIRYLKKIGWKRLPRATSDPRHKGA